MDSVHILVKDCGKTSFFFLKKTCMALGNSARKSADFAVRKYDEMCPAALSIRGSKKDGQIIINI